MKKFIVLLMLLIPTIVFADSLVSDPLSEHIGASYEIWQAAKNLTDAQVIAQGTLVANKPMETDGSIKYNLDSLPAGTLRWYIRAWRARYTYIDGTGKEVTGGSSDYSVFIPFDFTKRSPSSAPIKGLRLSTQP